MRIENALREEEEDDSESSGQVLLISCWNGDLERRRLMFFFLILYNFFFCGDISNNTCLHSFSSVPLALNAAVTTAHPDVLSGKSQENHNCKLGSLPTVEVQ